MSYIYDVLLGHLREELDAGYGIDITAGTISATGVEAVGGVGISTAGGTISLAPVSVSDVISGSGSAAVTPSNLAGALTSGQAVDVTSQPDDVTGDYRGTFSVSGTLGFTSFPKFASGLSYLFLADLTAATSGTVTPSGTWLDGTSAAKSLAAGTSTRVAMLFNAANKAKFTFASTGSVSVSHCREYEVTACSNEAIAYIAALSNPDAFASYYLIKPDMVQPWTSIIDMGSSPAVTIASGLSYKLNATGTHQLTVDTCPAGYDGRDAIIRIRLGGSGVIQAVAPLQLGGALIPYAVNNCVVRFRDGEAVLLVEDTLAGYVVTVNAGTGDGSLPYGLAANGVPYIAFSPSTDGIPVDLSGATTAAEEVTVVGNGYEETILSGGVTCTSKTTFANLAMSNVVNSGGTMTLGDVNIPNGATVAVSGGGLAVEKVTGAGSESVVDLGGTAVFVSSGSSTYASGCTFSGGVGQLSSRGGAFYVSGSADLTDCTITGNTAQQGGAVFTSNGTGLNLTRCIVSGNSATFQHGGIVTDCPTDIRDSIVSGNQAGDIRVVGATTAVTGSTIGSAVLTGGVLAFSDHNDIREVSGAGACVISAGASINLTSSINAGGITVLTGGCTVNGHPIVASTYTSIASDGTTVPPQPE